MTKISENTNYNVLDGHFASIAICHKFSVKPMKLLFG